MGVLETKRTSDRLLIDAAGPQMDVSGAGKILSNEWLTLIFRIVMAAIFIYAAWNKLLHPREFAISIAAYKVLPWQLINPSAILLPAIEMVIGLALLFGVFPRGAALIMLLLMVAFMAAFAIATINGVNIEDCGCFSTSHPIDKESKGAHYTFLYLLRDLGFTLMLIQLFFWGRHRFTLLNPQTR